MHFAFQCTFRRTGGDAGSCEDNINTGLRGSGCRTKYDYDSRHQIVAASDDVGYEAAFAYTSAGRVASAFVDAEQPFFAHQRDVVYTYDDVEPEAVAELNHAGSGARYASYGYDRSGNLTTRTLGSAKSAMESHSFAYDGDDQQRRVEAADGSSELYIYDHSGNRIFALSRAPKGNQIKLRQWLGASEIWYDALGKVDKSWVHVSLGTPIARIENGERLEYSFHSILGHMILATDRYGRVKAGYNYGPFGEVLDSVGEADTHLNRFNGKVFDAASGFSYYGARYYDLQSISFSQADPLYRFVPDLAFDEPRKMNLYAFTLNNPMRYMDPDGREAGTVVLVGGCIVTGGGACAAAAGAAVATLALVGGVIAAEAIGKGIRNWWNRPTVRHLPDTSTSHPPDRGRVTNIPMEKPIAPAPMERTKETKKTKKTKETRQTPNDKSGRGRRPSEKEPTAGHRKNKRKGNQEKHQKGDKRRDRDQGGEKGDKQRRPPKNPPPGHKGPWPPKTAQ